MKKTYFLSAIASTMVVFSACDINEDEPIVNGGDSNKSFPQELVVQVSDMSEGLHSRAGRPLYSTEAKQSIDKVKIIICDGSDSVLYKEDIANWNQDGVSTTYNTGGHGRMKTISIPESYRLRQGTYTVYAMGYHGVSAFTVDTLEEIIYYGHGRLKSDDFFVSLRNGIVAEEIFAGSQELEVKEGVGFNSKIILNRQVAGVFGYFENIPYVAGATKLQLVTKSNPNSYLFFGNFKNQILTSNGTSNTTEYVINGTDSWSYGRNVIYSINLRDWFGSDLKEKDGIFDTTNWTKPAKYGNNAKFKPGSVFGGEFIIPFAKTEDEFTFVLELTDDYNNVLRSWLITLDEESDGQCQNHNVFTYTFREGWVSSTNRDKKDCYNVVRNHLYGVGSRPQATPDVPGSGNDRPESLNKKEQLTLRINDNWEVIHKMDVIEL